MCCERCGLSTKDGTNVRTVQEWSKRADCWIEVTLCARCERYSNEAERERSWREEAPVILGRPAI
jgi:hypothetical protein